MTTIHTTSDDRGFATESSGRSKGITSNKVIPLERPLDSVAKPLSSLVVWIVVMSGKYVEIFSYAPDPSPLLPTAVSATPTRRASLVKVAALALGADGGCATGACSPPESEYCPPGYPGHPPSKANGTQRIIDYLNEAGESGVDLAVLPENAFGRPGMDVSACYHAPEPVDGESVKTVQALAKKWKMNVVLPLHEVREAGSGGGGAAKKMYNTAVVINRAGETV
eukprot:gene18795-6043_t